MVGYSKRGRESGAREFYVNFGGWCAHPTEDSEVFNRLPPWRQNEITDCANVTRLNPKSVAFAIYDIATGQPVPGQLLIASLTRDVVQQAAEPLPEIPLSIKFSMPNLPLTVFRQAEVGYEGRGVMSERISGRDLTFEQAHRIITALEAALTLPAMNREITVRGEGRKIKSNKPVDGSMAYIWRMARFHNGTDPSMPMTCYWDLEEGIEKLAGLRLSTALVTDNVKLILSALDKKTTELILSTGGDPLAGAKRWGRALGMQV